MPRRTGIVAVTTASLLEQIGGAAKHGTLHLAPRRTFTLMSLMKAAATSRPEGGAVAAALPRSQIVYRLRR